MMKTIAFSVMGMLVVATAQAVEVKEDSVWCVSQKTLARYESVKELDDKTYAERMLNKADCVERSKGVSAMLTRDSGEYVELEMTNGLSIWVMRNRVDGLPEAFPLEK
jgi:hypothetical protein